MKYHSQDMRMSVILCTRDPRPDIFNMCVRGLQQQTLPQNEWELVIVDNGSKVAIAESFDFSWHRNYRHFVEEIPGLIHARLMGIINTNTSLLFFLDDDNILDPCYLANVIEQMALHQAVGAASGRVEGVLETDAPIGISPSLRVLALNDRGHQKIFCRKALIRRNIVFGAGLVVKREVARLFVNKYHTIPQVRALGRRDGNLLGGEDILLAQCAYDRNMIQAYLPELHLLHYIKAERLTIDYIGKLRYASGLSLTLVWFAIYKYLNRIHPACFSLFIKLYELFYCRLYIRLRWGKVESLMFVNKARGIRDGFYLYRNFLHGECRLYG